MEFTLQESKLTATTVLHWGKRKKNFEQQSANKL